MSACLLCDRLGAHIAADGFSTPYVITMAFATAFYGFLGLWLSFRLARKYFAERWAFLATIGIWWASSLPVYMYFNPSWSHAHSAFAVALFLWYWHRTRGDRTIPQWILLGLLSGFIVDVYYPNGALLLIPLLEGISDIGLTLNRARTRRGDGPAFRAAFDLCRCAFAVALLPTFDHPADHFRQLRSRPDTRRWAVGPGNRRHSGTCCSHRTTACSVGRRF